MGSTKRGGVAATFSYRAQSKLASQRAKNISTGLTRQSRRHGTGHATRTSSRKANRDTAAHSPARHLLRGAHVSHAAVDASAATTAATKLSRWCLLGKSSGRCRGPGTKVPVTPFLRHGHFNAHFKTWALKRKEKTNTHTYICMYICVCAYTLEYILMYIVHTSLYFNVQIEMPILFTPR